MGRRVLLVQSENEAAQTLARFFTDRGDEVWIAWDLGQATALLQQVAPDLLLLDLHFPGDDWMSFIRLGRATFANLKVILTNKHPDLQREIIARQNGLNVFLRQPFTRRWLERALSAAETGTLLPVQPAFSSRVRVPTLVRISLPYLILMLVVIIAGAVLISRFSLRSGQQRFNLQSAELSIGSLSQVESFAVAASILLLVSAVGAYLVRRRANPFQSLAEAFSQVETGSLDVKVKPKRDVEAAFLARSFNRMVVGLQEGSLYRDLMGRTITPEMREQLRLTFSNGRLRLEGQEMVATVLISNLRNFAALSEGSDPVRVFEWLNEYYSSLVSIITAFGGVVHKLDGDAMMASFGALPVPQPPQESAQIACQAALEIIRALEELNFQRSRRGDVPLQTGIGINTGLAIAGGLGDKDRLYYTLIGDMVSTAQRLEAAMHDVFGASGVFLTQATFNALGDHTIGFRLEPQGLRALKGRSERIMIYRLLPVKALPEIQVML